MEYDVGQENSSYAVNTGNDSYGLSKDSVSYSGNDLGTQVDYSDRSSVGMNSSTRCPGGCSVCKGACRS